MSPDADMDDLSLMEDAKSTFHSHLAQHDISKDEAAVATRGPLGWLNAAPLLDALVNWIEGPPNRPQPKKNPNEKPNPILEIPFQFIALLTYPEPDPKAGDKMSLATLTNVVLSFYNSARMNVNMAKRAVGQRVGWAKQWAGGFFKRSNGGLANSNMNYTGNETMPLQQGITASNASSNKSVSYISSTAQTSESMMLRSGETSTSIIGEKLDSTQDNSPLIKRRGLFGKRKNYTVSLAPSQSVANSSIVSPTSAIGDGLNGDDVSVMTGRTKRGFFKRSTNNSSASRSATAPPSTIIDAQSPTPTTPKRPIHSSTPTSAVTTILPSKNGITILSTSPQPQSQSLSQLDLAMLPPRSPSPSALRKEFPVRSSGSSSATVAVAAAAPTASVPVLQAGSNQIGSHAVNSSSASSGASSPNYSPRTASFINPSIVATSSMANTSAATVSPVSTTITTTTTPTISTGRSLASAINPRSLLSSFTSQSHKQLQQSTTSPVTPTFPPHPHPIITNNSPATSTASSSTVPISPRPIKAAGLRTGLFLASSLSTSKLSNVLGGGSNRSSNDLTSHSNANGGGRGSMFEEEEKLEVTMEYQLQQHQQQPQFNPHRRASTTSTVGMIKYSELPSPDALMYREYPPQHPLAFGTTGQDPFLHHSHQPMWQMNSAAPRSGPLSGFKNDELAMARELNGRGGIGGGGMREDLLDPVTSAAADAMDGFGHEN
ncbi:hypothetical protein FBU30_001975 [Linnemannia zychae]|nr:hypothetical protein FBU30_001975 [Linnemannia zychae]